MREMMRGIFGFGLFGLIFLCVSTRPATAQIDRSITCGFYFSGKTANIPRSVEAAMSELHHTAAHACTSSDDTIIDYTEIGRITQGRFGVCVFDLQRKAGSPGTSNSPPGYSTFMAVPSGECPEQSDPRYIASNGVSEGMFVAILAFFNQITSSEDGLNAALDLKSGDTADSHRMLDALKSDLLHRDTPFKPVLRSIELTDPFLRGLSSGYRISITSHNVRLAGWTLQIDLTPNGLKILNFERWIV
jgi:hypothetical protein